MRIAVTAQDNGFNAYVDQRFGRAKCFAIIDIENREIRNIDNTQNLNAKEGAGIQAAQTIANNNASVLITGNIGPKAYRTLNSAGIEVYIGAKGTVEKAVESYLNGQLEKASSDLVDGGW